MGDRCWYNLLIAILLISALLCTFNYQDEAILIFFIAGNHSGFRFVL